MSGYIPIGEFDKKEPWSRYIERFSENVVANGITNAAQKRAMLHLGVGPATYALFC